MMRLNIRILAVFISVGILSGCATWSQFKKIEYKDSARKFSAEVPLGWMKYNLVHFFIMTRNGIILEKVVVERRKFNFELEATKKKFAADMTPQELAEVEIDNLKANPKLDRVDIGTNKPYPIDGRTAFKLEYSYYAEGGLKVQGIRYGFVEGEFVYRIYYEAAEQYYFEKYAKDFEHFIATFKLLK